jgi:hypothetical protein
MPVLEALARLLEKSNKADEAKEVLARISKLEERDYQEYTKSFPFKPDAFAGRKGSSDRAVLVELFTGAECPPCVAADLAFDGLGQAYKPSEVVRLQYHIHIPGPDPLTSPAALTRAAYYRVMDKGTPVTFFNGKEAAGGGGLNPAAARTKFGQYKAAIDPQLETPPAARLRVTAQRAGDNLSVSAAVSDLVRPGDKVRLRLALAEETVRYRGGNGIRYHHCVVRGFIGPAEGFALAQRSGEHRAGLNLADLRSALNGYLDKFLKEKENEGVTFAERPLNLRSLHVVAFVQDDATQEVLQAQRAEVK